MFQHRKRTAAVIFTCILLGLVLSACRSSTGSAARTVTAAMNQLTETANAVPTSTNTPEPTPTLIPSPPPALPTLPPEAPAETSPPPASGPTLTASVDTNCRLGPDPIYPIMGAFIKDNQADILGTNESRTWWVIENPSKPGENCWVWSQTTRADGDTSTVPIVEPPPMPEEELIPYPYPLPEIEG